jgi:hypothetical protein
LIYPPHKLEDKSRLQVNFQISQRKLQSSDIRQLLGDPVTKTHHLPLFLCIVAGLKKQKTHPLFSFPLHVAGLKKAMQHKLFKDPQKITEEGMTWWLNPHEEDKPWKAHKQARFTTTRKTEIERRIGAQLHAKKKKKKKKKENPFFF